MISDAAVRAQVLATFALLNKGRAKAFPAPTTLSKTLEKISPNKSSGILERHIDAKGASCFATAAVEIWLRSVHSFLVSASLTEASPIWSSVSGYYASHYTVRGIAHLLGYFQLFNRRKIVRLKVEGGRYTCTFMSKGANDGEHKVYWKLVKQSEDFKGDDLFTQKDEEPEYADALHRNHGNYADHVSAHPRFKPLSEDALKLRIEYISKIVIDAPLLPRVSDFPDLERVQLIAYHRIVKFRRVLDELLGNKNRFWNVHRNPSFSSGYIDFQLAESRGLAQL